MQKINNLLDFMNKELDTRKTRSIQNINLFFFLNLFNYKLLYNYFDF